ncbi:MAG: hypothetical protein JWL91_1955 [Sphingomonas bacterium]|nr:heavy-metal-associated domain-containing protein [Sphingomonas bacterium]MDB5690079.1 hypothetical protein [Sphingomonas bacterium]
MTISRRLLHPLTLSALVGMLAVGSIGLAQLEGDRGVPPIDSSKNYEVGGVSVDVSAKTADAARTGGWRLAQRKGWRMLWARANGLPIASAPNLPDSTLDSIVAGIVVEDEQIGANRYIARLGVLFDRSRAGQMLGVQGQGARSAPMLVIPVLWSGATPMTFEVRNEWQRAWARFRAGGSPIDYVRVAGTGTDPLLLNLAQTRRPGRGWWRMLLDQYGASDIVMPEVTLVRSWPGGPVTGHFVARHGPDATEIESFTLRAADSAGLPRMLDEGIRRIDDAYAAALRDGRLSPDRSLILEVPTDIPVEEALAETSITENAPILAASSFTIEVDTPDAGAVGGVEQSLRAVPGVRSAAATSLAIGGVSLMRVTFDGEQAALRIALAARGWRVEDGGGGRLRIRRAPVVAAPVPATPPPPPAAPAAPR